MLITIIITNHHVSKIMVISNTDKTFSVQWKINFRTISTCFFQKSIRSMKKTGVNGLLDCNASKSRIHQKKALDFYYRSSISLLLVLSSLQVRKHSDLPISPAGPQRILLLGFKVSPLYSWTYNNTSCNRKPASKG